MNVLTLTSHLLCKECAAKFDKKKYVPMAPTFSADVYLRSGITASPGMAQVFAEAYSKLATTGVTLCCHVAVAMELAFPPEEPVKS